MGSKRSHFAAAKGARNGHNAPVTKVVVIGGGPGGYEAALVAAQEGAHVVLIERDGVGGAAVLTDCVPSKTLVATARSASLAAESADLGVRVDGHAIDPSSASVDLKFVFDRVRQLAAAQSRDITERLVADGVEVRHGKARIAAPGVVEIVGEAGSDPTTVNYDVLLVATGARPRELPDAMPDGQRILNWKQVWNLTELPDHLIVIGSGVTGAEFAGAFTALGVEVTLVSSRDRVLPTQDPDAADVVEGVFTRRGMKVLGSARALSARVSGDLVTVSLADGSDVVGSHCLVAVGAVPNTEDLGLDAVGVRTGVTGTIEVDRVSRTNVLGIYAAGDVTGVNPLASVAAMQGRIAMWHAFGDAVTPLNLTEVSQAVFTDPEIASVGVAAADVTSGRVPGRIHTQPLSSNARAKMQGLQDGFVKLVVSPDGVIRGGVVVAPRASDLIHAIAMAVSQHLTADDVAETFTVYPSMSGSIAEAARRLHVV